MTKTQKIPLASVVATAVLAGCKKDNELTSPAPVNDEELITDAYLHFRDDAGNAYQWPAYALGVLEPGGESGLQITADTLPANTLLQAGIILLNRSVTPVDTVSHEVPCEGEEYQFFFLTTNTNITISYVDQDANGHPIGLHSTWQTGTSATGQVTVLLRQEPDKGATGVSDGDITNAGGSNDLEVEFPAVVWWSRRSMLLSLIRWSFPCPRDSWKEQMILHTALIRPPMNKNYITYLILGVGLLCMPFGVHAQKQYWGTTYRGYDPVSGSVWPQLRFGGIVRVDSNAMNPEIILGFDTAFSSSLGMPQLGCGLMQASNGLIYYMTQQQDLPYHTRVIALDPVTDSAWVAAELGTPDFPWRGQRSLSSLIEGTPGHLIDATQDPFAPSRVFRFDLATNALSLVTTLPSGIDGFGNPIWPTFIGTLTKATDNRVFGGTNRGPMSPLGAASWINPATNNFHLGFVSMDPFNGFSINGPTVQVGPKLFATTSKGGLSYVGWPVNEGYGTIGSFSLGTDTYQKELDLDSSASNPARGFVLGSDGLLYGEARTNDTIIAGIFPPGCLFAYNPATNSLQRKTLYGLSPLGHGMTGTFLDPGLLAASNGKIYGSFQKGLFEYDPVADTLKLRAPLQFVQGEWVYPYGLQSPLIEICRKPNYKPRSTTTFTVCEGSYFSYDLHNVNATGVVWRRNGQVVPAQTAQRLEFSAITAADAGTWACTLTNECGATEPPPITITVQAGSFTTSTISGDTLLCGHGDSAVLTGNNGGTWNTGDTTPTLTVTEPGTYYVTNTGACGTSMSNLVHVAHLDSAMVPPTVFSENWQLGHYGTQHICPGGPGITLTGNTAGPWGLYTPGTWSTGDTGPSITAQDTGSYYVAVANACNADTMHVVRLEYLPDPPVPQLAFTDVFGEPADNLLCTGDSVTVMVTNMTGSFFPCLWTFPDGSQTITYDGQSIVASMPGEYLATRNDGCVPIDTTFLIQMDDAPPQDPPVILPDQDFLTGCVLDTAYLSSAYPNSYWQWYTGPGQPHADTTQMLTVDWSVDPYSLYTYNGCGNSPPDIIQVTGIPVPVVAYVQDNSLACINHPAFTLAPGTPPGGTYSGPGVSGNTFDPALAGMGTHAVTYSYGEGNCMAQATDSITVDLCTGVEEADGESGIRIHPNPNTGEFTVEVGRPFRQGRLLLYDARGKQVGKALPLQPGSNTITRRGLAAGVYHLRVELDGQTIERSLVVQPGGR